jgi:Tfp pilus assembly protein FimT
MEMMVVAAIFVICAGVAIPSFLYTTRAGKIRNDADNLANLVVQARMRASAEFAEVRLNCQLAPASGPGYCQLQSLQYSSNNANSWTAETNAPTVYLSGGVSFKIPGTIASGGYLSNQSTAAYQGDPSQNTPTATTNPVIVVNSRGIAVQTNGTSPATVSDPNYALYIGDQAGNYYAISIPLVGRPWIYQWVSSSSQFVQRVD